MPRVQPEVVQTQPARITARTPFAVLYIRAGDNFEAIDCANEWAAKAWVRASTRTDAGASDPEGAESVHRAVLPAGGGRKLKAVVVDTAPYAATDCESQTGSTRNHSSTPFSQALSWLTLRLTFSSSSTMSCKRGLGRARLGVERSNVTKIGCFRSRFSSFQSTTWWLLASFAFSSTGEPIPTTPSTCIWR